MVLLISLLFLATCCLLAAWWKRRVRLSHATRNIPKVSGQVPILGIGHRLVSSSDEFWTYLKKVSNETNDKGGITRAWFGPAMLNVCVTDPKLSVAISNACLKKTFFYDWGKGLLGDGIGTSEGNKWKAHRKILNPAFNQNVLNSFMHIFNRQSSKLIMDLSQYVDSGEFRPKSCVSNKALETICQHVNEVNNFDSPVKHVLLSFKVGRPFVCTYVPSRLKTEKYSTETVMGLPENKMDIADDIYQKAMETFLNIVSIRLRSPWIYSQTTFKLTALKRKENACIKIIKKKTKNVLEKSKKEIMQMEDNNKNSSQMISIESPELPKNGCKPLMQLLLQQSDIGQLSDEEIADEINIAIAAGYETTASTLVQILILIGSYKEVQDKIYKELYDIFGNTYRDVTKEDLTKLVYLEAVIKECLRLYPPLPFISRTVEEDFQIGDITLPTGVDILFSIWGINRHPCWGADRNEFNPDRWMSSDTLPSNPNAFATFAMGKRHCIGRTYAMMSLKVSLVHIVRKYQVKGDCTKLKFDYNFVMSPIAGDTICIELR